MKKKPAHSDITAEEAKAIRLRLGLTQTEMAAELGIHSGSNYARLERGEMPYTFAMGELLRAYGAGYKREVRDAA